MATSNQGIPRSGGKRVSRRNTATTASMSVPEMLEETSLSQEPYVDWTANDLDRIVDLLTKEVVDQMAKAALDDESNSSATGSSQDTANSPVSIEGIAERIAESVQKITGRSDDFPDSISSTKSSLETSTESAPTDLSNDVWHSDFWCADVVDMDKRAAPSHPDTLAQTNESAEIDDCSSVLSELSGLTGVFTESSAPQQQARKDIILQTTSRMPQHPNCATSDTKRSLVVHVGFQKITVREYERILGDNPSCSSGPSLAIGWAYRELGTMRVDDFESIRTGRRKGKDLVLNRQQREKMLRNSGHTIEDIAEAVRRLNKARAQRQQTINNLGSQKMEEVIESATKKIKKLLSSKRRA